MNTRVRRARRFRSIVDRRVHDEIALPRRIGESLREISWDDSLLPEDREYRASTRLASTKAPFLHPLAYAAPQLDP